MFGRTKRKSDHEPLPDYARAYLNHLSAEYKALPFGADTPERKQIREAAARICNCEASTWGDIYVLENCILRLQSFEALRQRASSIRQKYGDLASDSDYTAYLKTAPNLSNASEADLRADLEHVLSEFHWIYSYNSVLETERSRIANWVRNLTLVVVAMTGGLALADYVFGGQQRNWTFTPTLPLVMAMGAIGGFISLQQRIQSVPIKGDPIVSILQLTNSRSSVYLAPVSGAVFASLLYLMFIAMLIQGAIFPNIWTPRKLRTDIYLPPLNAKAGVTGPSEPKVENPPSTGGVTSTSATGPVSIPANVSTAPSSGVNTASGARPISAKIRKRL